MASGALVPVMTRHPPPPAGAYVIRPPGQHPARKIRVLTELLIEYCEPAPHLAVSIAEARTARSRERLKRSQRPNNL
jgi:hypothetical protein